jgi:hypothetical protein
MDRIKHKLRITMDLIFCRPGRPMVVRLPFKVIVQGGTFISLEVMDHLQAA